MHKVIGLILTALLGFAAVGWFIYSRLTRTLNKSYEPLIWIVGIGLLVTLVVSIFIGVAWAMRRDTQQTIALVAQQRQVAPHATVFPAQYVGPQPIGPDGSAITGSAVFVVDGHQVTVWVADKSPRQLITLDASHGVRVRTHTVSLGSGTELTQDVLALAHPRFMVNQAEESYATPMTPELMTSYAVDIAGETGIALSDLPQDPQALIATLLAANETSGGYVGWFVPSNSNHPVFRAPELRFRLEKIVGTKTKTVDRLEHDALVARMAQALSPAG